MLLKQTFLFLSIATVQQIPLPMARKHGTAMALRMEPILPSTSMGRYCGPLTQQTEALRKPGLVSMDSMS